MTKSVTISIEWTGLQEMDAALVRYGNAVIAAVEAVAAYFEPVFDAYAKEEASWKDRTGNARQTLHTWSKTLADDVVELWLGHGMEYGKYLERRWGGRYAIIWTTIEAHLDAIARMLQDIFA